MGLNSDFKLSGSSVRPAYPGFMVIKIAVSGLIGVELSSKLKKVKLSLSYLVKAFKIWWIYWATTDNTSISILLNSSKHPHPPV